MKVVYILIAVLVFIILGIVSLGFITNYNKSGSDENFKGPTGTPFITGPKEAPPN